MLRNFYVVKHIITPVATKKLNTKKSSSNMTTAVIYSNGSQECERMGMLLQDLKNIDEYLEYRLDKHFTLNAFQQEFGEEATFPQIAIGDKHIGGMKESLRYMSDKGMFL
tara:strand:+ start:2884 stop:3213 length:330 start_codon:yes stop_codon:yes gene_type:complete